MKSPYSSVKPCAKLDFLFLPLTWQLTDTKAPADFGKKKKADNDDGDGEDHCYID